MTLAGLIICITLLLAIRLPRGARITFIACVCFSTIIVIINSVYPHSLPGADADARRFFLEAVDRASGESRFTYELTALLNGSNAYLNLQGALQAIGGPSLLLAHSVSVLGGGLCLVSLCNLWCEAGGSLQRMSMLMLCFSVLPSVAFYNSFILREVWQTLIILAVARITGRCMRRGMTAVAGLQLVTLLACGAFLHKVMPFIIIAVVMGSAISGSLQRQQDIRSRRRASGYLRPVAIGLVAIGVLSPIIGSSQFLSSALEQGVLESSVDYSTRSLQDARAEYGVLFNVEQPWTIVQAFLAYECEPLPSRIQGRADVIAVVENAWRIWLFLAWMIAARQIRFGGKSTGLVIAWMLVELIWAVGTINWGTAMRHHVPAYGLLLCGSMLAKEESAVALQRVRRSDRPSVAA